MSTPERLYVVFENDKPACTTGYPDIDESWNNCLFHSFKDAEEYALNWLGIYAPENRTLEVNKPFEYNSPYGNDSITIWEV